MNKKILHDISKYYSEKIIKFGNNPKGVDWKDEESQIIRFEKLIEVIRETDSFTINDLGCGYGKLFELLNSVYKTFNYKGYDLSGKMISNAVELYGINENAKFFLINGSSDMVLSDYTLASGIFNVKMNYNHKEWERYIVSTINEMDKKSTGGFSFNMLTKYSDKDKMRDDLYYADPCYFFDFCKNNFAKNVSLLHDYNLYEFTILVKKQS